MFGRLNLYIHIFSAGRHSNALDWLTAVVVSLQAGGEMKLI